MTNAFGNPQPSYGGPTANGRTSTTVVQQQQTRRDAMDVVEAGASSAEDASARRRPAAAVRCFAACGQGAERRGLFLSNAALSVFHTALFLATVLVGNRSLTVPVYRTDLNFTEREAGEDSSKPKWELVPRYEGVADVGLTWLVASFFAISALAHFGNAFVWRGYYERGIANCMTPTRFVEYFFSAAVMILVIAYQVGVREYGLLLAVAGLIATTMGHGYLVELVARPESEDKWSRSLGDRLAAYWLGWIPQLVAWTILVLSFYDQDYSDAPNGPPVFVYVILWGELALFSSFGIVMLWQQCNPPRRYVVGEYAYQLLSLVSKGLLGGVMLSMVLVLGSFEESLVE
jgi:hypothetical protein